MEKLSVSRREHQAIRQQQKTVTASFYKAFRVNESYEVVDLQGLPANPPIWVMITHIDRKRTGVPLDKIMARERSAGLTIPERQILSSGPSDVVWFELVGHKSGEFAIFK